MFIATMTERENSCILQKWMIVRVTWPLHELNFIHWVGASQDSTDSHVYRDHDGVSRDTQRQPTTRCVRLPRVRRPTHRDRVEAAVHLRSAEGEGGVSRSCFGTAGRTRGEERDRFLLNCSRLWVAEWAAASTGDPCCVAVQLKEAETEALCIAPSAHLHVTSASFFKIK